MSVCVHTCLGIMRLRRPQGKLMLGPVDMSSFEEEEQEKLYRHYKSLLAPGDFFPGDAFVKGACPHGKRHIHPS